MNFIDLFSGAGGLSEGFIKAGFNPIAHVEIDKHACNTLETRLVYHKLKSENNLGHYYDYLKGETSRENFISSFGDKLLSDSVMNIGIGGKNNKFIFNKIDELAGNNEIDLVILDLELPDMLGIEVLKIIKENPLNCSLPVIVLSGTNDPELISRVLKGGASDFVSKPFNIEEFTLKISLWTQLASKTSEIHCLKHLLNEYSDIVYSNNIVSKSDVHGVFTYVNDKFCVLSGYKREELIGNQASMLRDPEISDSIFKELWENINKKQIWNGELTNRNKNGDIYKIKVSIKPILDSSGDIFELLAIYEEVE